MAHDVWPEIRLTEVPAPASLLSCLSRLVSFEEWSSVSFGCFALFQKLWPSLLALFSKDWRMALIRCRKVDPGHAGNGQVRNC